MSLTLGEKLRQAREERGISIAEVAEQTRISPHYLEFIENDDFRTLPGGIFNKGFVKSYAKYVGIDEQEALQDYSKLVSSQESEVSEEPKTYRPEVLTDDRAGSSILPTAIIAIVILGLMTWGILELVKYVQNNPNALTTANTNSSNANSAMNANSANTNSATANANTSAPLPSVNEIKLEFKTSETVSVEATVDGKKASKVVAVETPETYTATQSLKLRYYRGFADKVQLTLNGKQITAPPAPAKGNGIEFEINKENIAQILQSGQISAPPAPNANANTANTATAPR
ncbi:MAG TPA: helix-turn-helix domain-containing protein [Pyrinomonadaceae bacterium]|nr:helix-turn-helix domain-containing protein [Pyrinomonadaceae bacterium]